MASPKSKDVDMEPGEKCSFLLKKCVKVLETFEPKKTTVDAYMQDAECLKDKKLQDTELKFIHQVFYGCIRYQKFLRLFVTSFMYKCPATALRAEQSLYTVMAYLLFFRLEELTVPEFRHFLSCGYGTPPALLALMQYALSVEELEKWVKVEWCKLYDVDYIEQDIIGKLQGFSDKLKGVVEEVEFKATGTIKADGTDLKTERKATEFKPFNLTRPRPRLIPEPEVMSREVKAQPVPAGIHKNSLSKVEEQRKKKLEEEKARVQSKYTESDHFSLETGARRDHEAEMELLKKKVEEEQMAECTFNPKTSKKVVAPDDATVRHNVASVLREDALLKQKQAKEYQILKRYEEDLHDASQFHSWQEKMKEKDHLEEEARVRQRIMEMQLARESAMESFDSAVRRKHIVAEHQREELQLGLELKEKEKECELGEKKMLVEETKEDRVRARAAEQEALKDRANNADNMRKEREVELERKKREDEQEMERKRDLIREIRALEKVPVERAKLFDPAEPPCQGLLEEMSLAELKERLRIVTAQKEKELDMKRERQLAKKVEKQEELTEKAEMLQKVRERAREEQKEKSEQLKRQKQLEEEQRQRHREKCILEVAEKLQLKKRQKKEEEQRLKLELKEISTKRQFLAAKAEMVEAKAHAEQQAGLDREAQKRQKVTLAEQRRKNQIKVSEDQRLRDNQEREVQEYQQMQQTVATRLERAKAADVALKDEILQSVASARSMQRQVGKRGMQEHGHSQNAYMKRIQGRMATSC
mmetsp:Transcript_130980/g.310636  ORF Transcript_130980/g.310636 Transcript_130980/m.310636 type:complete len:762 (-) Transcript_130980:14-2299(-)